MMIRAAILLLLSGASCFAVGDVSWLAKWSANGGGSSIPTEGLVAEWLFTSDASDSSGNGYDGLLTNGASVSGGRLVLDGVDDYVNLSAHEPLYEGVTNLTVTGWFMTTDTARQAIVGEVYSQVAHVEMGLGGAGLVRSWWRNNNGTVYAESVTNYADGSWHFYASTFSDGVVLLYIDQAETASNSVASAYVPNNANNFPAIGAIRGLAASHNALWFDGEMDNKRLYHRILTDEEIQTIYEEGHD